MVSAPDNIIFNVRGDVQFLDPRIEMAGNFVEAWIQKNGYIPSHKVASEALKLAIDLVEEGESMLEGE